MKLNDLIFEYLEKSKYSIKKRTLLNYYQNTNTYVKDSIGQSELQDIDNNILNDYILSKYKGYGENETIVSSTNISGGYQKEFTITESGYYGFAFKRADNADFDFTNTDPIDLASFVTITIEVSQ